MLVLGLRTAVPVIIVQFALSSKAKSGKPRPAPQHGFAAFQVVQRGVWFSHGVEWHDAAACNRRSNPGTGPGDVDLRPNHLGRKDETRMDAALLHSLPWPYHHSDVYCHQGCSSPRARDPSRAGGVDKRNASGNSNQAIQEGQHKSMSGLSERVIFTVAPISQACNVHQMSIVRN